MGQKKCFKCGEIKPLSEFYKHSRMADGHLNKCKECTKKDARKTRSDNIEYYREYDRGRSNLPHRVEARQEYYSKVKDTKEYKQSSYLHNKEYRQNNKEKEKAHRKIQYYLSKGYITKKPCEICGEEKSEAHHDDYSKPLDVRWLCRKHHMEEHVQSGSFCKK